MSVVGFIVEVNRPSRTKGEGMAAITLEVDLAWTQDDTIDPTVDSARVWCDYSAGAARVVGGFCEHCGARDHDDL
jgi:hypothetical protein